MAKIKLSSPWDEHYKKISAMFKNDPDVHVFYDEDKRVIKLYVDNQDKANALDEILVHELKFGRVTLDVQVVPADSNYTPDVTHNVYARAFTGNSALVSVEAITGIFDKDIIYVVFKKDVVQYFNDNLSDLHGMRSILYQDIAREIFNEESFVFFCTDVPAPVK